MKKIIVFLILFLSLNKIAFSAMNENNELLKNEILTEEKKGFDELKYQIRGDFAIFLQELYNERERGVKEADNTIKNINNVLSNAQEMIEESRTELRVSSYKQNRNLLIASLFLWISITIFIIMNLKMEINYMMKKHFQQILNKSQMLWNLLNVMKRGATDVLYSRSII